jgi:hypothetical protein
MNTQLDPFETRLLAELRQVVAEQAATGARSAQSNRLLRWGAVAATLAVAAGAVTFQLTGATPAFAVDPAPDGSVTVKVRRLEGAQGLQADLAKAGIKADVSFNAPFMQCQMDRGKAVTDVALYPWTYQAADGGYEMWIPPHLLKPGQTLVIDSSWPGPGAWALGIGVIEGPVAPCNPVSTDSLLPSSEPIASTDYSTRPVPCPSYPSYLPGASSGKCVAVDVTLPSPTR